MYDCFTKNNERYIGFKKLKKGKKVLLLSVITYTFGRLTTKKHNKVMKKLIFLFAFCIVVTNVFAQTAPEQLKKEGNDAFNAKNYPVAYAKFSEYLKQTIERLETLGKYGSASKHRSLLSRLSQFRSLNI